ncbi:MAG TPA: chromate transporter [Firmicutes bacterium]|nr:chromate transporter [Bacillota bacterium]
MILRLLLTFAKIGTFAFGGGYAMIPFFERELVARNGWISHAQLWDAVVLSQATPGPIATSAAVVVGYWKAGFWGAAVATTAVLLPSALLVWLLGRLVVRHGQVTWLRAVFAGLRPVVVALIAVAAFTMAPASVPDWRSAAVMVATGIAVGYFRLHPILAILGAGLVGIIIF